MRAFKVFFTTMSLAVLLAACSSGPKVRSDFDHSANFASYKTFAFVSPLGTDVDGYSTLITQHIKSATEREMQARGYRYSETDPDLLLNFSARLANKVKTNQVASQQIGYYSYRNIGVYKTWPSYAYQNNVEEYTEGTLNIDLVDARQKQLVWEGVAVGRVTDDKLANPGPAIDKVVADIFAKYTYRAAP